MADTKVSNTFAERRAGSSPASGTVNRRPPFPLGRSRAGLVAVLLAGLCALGGPGSARTGSSRPPTTGPTTTLSPAEVVARADALGLLGTWRAGSGSAAGYRMTERAVGGGAPTIAVGRTTRTDGTLVLAAAGRGVVVQAFDIRVDMTGLQSGDALRDQRLRTSGLETDRYRTATFVADAGQRLPDAAASGKDLTWQLAGRLTLHGVSRRVRLPLVAGVRSGRLEIVGSLPVTLADHRITAPSVPGVLVVDPVATFECKVVLFR